MIKIYIFNNKLRKSDNVTFRFHFVNRSIQIQSIRNNYTKIIYLILFSAIFSPKYLSWIKKIVQILLPVIFLH